ncbi:BatD family protein [Chitinophaga rhizophila]|uniref:BatD family protein n=1 Tax=Chitinophaga rhizophila TaxID=2866212 RepID=A0ABS7GG69_9BACT|nr:BatD family protein [Chitinophaga rhizophila]MBW8685799.1 BatD family protein [Chitinophaga rhizophila]
MAKLIIVKHFILFFLLGFILAPIASFAQQQGEVKASVDTQSIRLGEQIQLRLSATMPPQGMDIVFPQIPDSFGHFEVVRRSQLDTTAAGNTKVLGQTIVLTSFDSGRWDIPALRFDLASGGNVTDSAFTAPLFIDVNTVSVDTTQAFKPIKGLRTVAWSFWDYWLYFAIGITVALIGIGLFVYLRSRPKKQAPVPVVAVVPPYEIALQQLQQLKAEKVWQQGDSKQYYTRLTDILRSYFENQFNIPALEQTTEELLQHIKPVTILNQQRDKLRALLSLADLAKFAKLMPSPEEHEGAMQHAQEIVEWTKPAANKAATADNGKEEIKQPAK